jgi:hypothetical protein
MYDRFLTIHVEIFILEAQKEVLCSKAPVSLQNGRRRQNRRRHAPANTTMKKTRLTVEERQQVVSQLMIGCTWVDDEPKLGKKALTRVATDFNKHVTTVWRVWCRARQKLSQFGKLTSTTRKSTGRPRVYIPVEVAKAMEDVPTEKRGAIRSLASALGISATTVHRLKMGRGYDVSVIRPHSNAIKPYLEDVHHSARAYYARSKLDLTTGLYDGFYQSVHVDEKWFL